MAQGVRAGENLHNKMPVVIAPDLRQLVAEQAVGVLIAAPLPRVMRSGEVKLDTGALLGRSVVVGLRDFAVEFVPADWDR